jgi:hypothetical protein
VIPNAENLEVSEVVVLPIPVDVIYVKHSLVHVIPTGNAALPVGTEGTCSITRDPFPISLYLEHPRINLFGSRQTVPTTK